MSHRATLPVDVRSVVLLEPRAPDIHIFSRYALPRLGVVLLGTILRDRGLKVRVMIEEAAPFDMQVVRSADLVGISSITSTAPRAYALGDELRALGIPVVMGGPHPTHCPDEALEHADFVVRGEGEIALPAIVDALRAGTGLESIEGLSWRAGPERRHNPIGPLLPDLDAWPDPDLSLLPPAKSVSFVRSLRVVPLQTSRGCPHDCSFCTVTTTFGRKMRYRSVERVVAEMEKFDLKRSTFFFYDDNFTASPRRAREMIAGIRSLPSVPEWTVQVRADVARDRELLKEMKAAGCNTFCIGLESINEETLRSTKKRQSLDEVDEHLTRIREAGIDVHGMFVLGFDTDSEKTMERTVAFAKRHRLFSVQFMILTPLPGSRVHKEMVESGRILQRDWGLYDAHHVCFQPSRITPIELQRWQMEGHRRFYAFGQTLRRLVRGELSGVAVNLYAAGLQRRWRRHNAEYLAALERISSGAREAVAPAHA